MKRVPFKLNSRTRQLFLQLRNTAMEDSSIFLSSSFLPLSSPPSPPFLSPFQPLPPSLPPVPSEPRNVSSTALTSTSFTVTWLPPASPNGIIDNYTLQYTDITAGRMFIKTGITTESQVLEGLSPARDYQVVVSALTDKGPGPESVPLDVTTLEDGKT